MSWGKVDIKANMLNGVLSYERSFYGDFSFTNAVFHISGDVIKDSDLLKRKLGSDIYLIGDFLGELSTCHKKVKLLASVNGLKVLDEEYKFIFVNKNGAKFDNRYKVGLKSVADVLGVMKLICSKIGVPSEGQFYV